MSGQRIKHNSKIQEFDKSASTQEEEEEREEERAEGGEGKTRRGDQGPEIIHSLRRLKLRRHPLASDLEEEDDDEEYVD